MPRHGRDRRHHDVSRRWDRWGNLTPGVVLGICARRDRQTNFNKQCGFIHPQQDV
jgi:hypothetical protein